MPCCRSPPPERRVLDEVLKVHQQGFLWPDCETIRGFGRRAQTSPNEPILEVEQALALKVLGRPAFYRGMLSLARQPGYDFDALANRCWREWRRHSPGSAALPCPCSCLPAT